MRSTQANNTMNHATNHSAMSAIARRTLRRPRRPPTLALSVGALIALSAATAQAQTASPSPTTTEATIEITESDSKGAGHTVRFTMALDDTDRPATIESSSADADYKLSISRHSAKSPGPIVQLRVKRISRQGKQASEYELHAAARLNPGRSILMGKIERADGGQVTVQLTLR